MCNQFFRENKCTEHCDQRKTLVIRDLGNRQEYRVTNETSKELCKIRVDNCLIKEGEKCDYLILDCQDELAFFTELKGHDLGKAFTQIHSSIDQLANQVNNFKIYARIVLNRTPSPDINSTLKIKLMNKLKKHNGDRSEDSRELVKYKSRVLEESI